MKFTSPETIISEIEARRVAASANAFAVADAAIAGVRERGDAYVAEQIARFDGVEIAPDAIAIPCHPERSEGSSTSARAGSFAVFAAQDDTLRSAIQTAIERIESFHLEQLPRSYTWQRDDTRIVHRVRPLDRVGIYVPGGRAVYLSTLIMCAVPARIAGVRELVVATPAAAAARPELQYACSLLGISQIYRSGGAAAIAALALGTGTLRRVDKIVGPGNSYVTAAKARLIGEVGIDMTAGPTELIVIADDTADPTLVAADLAAQAEHGPDSAVILIATSERIAQAISDLQECIVFTASIDDAVAFSNRVAPEHLSIHTRDAEAVAAAATNAGAIYVGRTSAPAAGDYILGSNHVLPTAGSARFFSPLGVYDFVKRSNVVSAGARDLAPLIELAKTLAEFEGLPKHAASVAARAS